jgi:hypothetical protein
VSRDWDAATYHRVSGPQQSWPTSSWRGCSCAPIPQLWNFASPSQTADRLAKAGFADPVCWLEDRPTTSDEPRDFARTSILVRHLDVLGPEQRDAFVDRVMDRFVADRGEPAVFDYVRLNMTAVRAGAGRALR